MTPKRPHLVRAYYEWLLENELTPHLVVDAEWPGTSVPAEFVKEGQIVLNIHPDAVSAFQLGHQQIIFQARFQGVPRNITVPYGAVLAMYSRENGAGTIFEQEPFYLDMKAAYLKAEKEIDQAKPTGLKRIESLESLASDASSQQDAKGRKNKPKGPPSLKRIK